MNFRNIKSSIVCILGDAACGRFRTIGYQQEQKSAEGVLDNSRMVQVYYLSSDFGKSAGRNIGRVMNDITFAIALTVASESKADLSVLNSSTATASQRMMALAAFQEATDLADQSFDELVEIVYQILMDGRNYDMGQTVGTVSSRWISSIQKDDTVNSGGYVTLTGTMHLTMRAFEDIVGEELGNAVSTLDNTLDLRGDDVERTGVTITR